jgi:2-methylcitrate dehydratase PrpD
MNRIYEDDGLTTRMARFVCRTAYSDLPGNVVDYVKVMTADALACGFGASVLPGARNLVKVAEKWGGRPDAVILTTGRKVSATAAAFANAYLINALDADDTFYTNGHPLAPIFASALAVAEEVGASGVDFIAALAVGYDTAIRVKRSFGEKLGGSFGAYVMGCAAASARLHRLGEVETAMAFGVAAFGGPHSSGRWNQNASGRRHDLKYWVTDYQAWAGVSAVELVKAGVTGDRTVFDGNPNYSHFLGFDGMNEELMFEDIGRRWFIAETSVKPWAVCRYAQVSITLLQELMKEHDIAPGEIDKVEIQTWEFIAGPWFSGKVEITDQMDVQFSFRHAVAAALLGWDMGPEWQGRAIGNAELDAAADKVFIATNPRYAEDSIVTIDGNRHMATVLTLRTARGSYTREGGIALGDPYEDRYRMTLDRIADKFFLFSRQTLDQGRMEQVFSRVASLEKLENIRFQLTC